MNVFEFVIVLVIAILGFRLWETRIKIQDGVAREADDENLRSKLEALEQRIQVLERIVTDSQFDLRREFEDLENETRNNG